MAKKSINKKSAKKISTTRKKNKAAVKSVKPAPRKANKFNKVQSILSSYFKESNTKLGLKRFNEIARDIYRNPSNSDLRYVEQNIEQIYKNKFVTVPTKTVFPTDIPFFDFVTELIGAFFTREPGSKLPAVQVSYTFSDAMLQDSFKGTPTEVVTHYKNVLHAHLRRYYSESPYAVFKKIASDEKTFVDYEVVIDGGGMEAALEDSEIAQEVAKLEKESTQPEKQEESAVTKEINIEQEKQRTADKLIELEKEKQRTAEKILELIKAGVPPEQAAKLIG